MKSEKQYADFLHIGKKILTWYATHKRSLPWRENPEPYKIWICEIIFQQTQVKQGLNHYINFIERFPDVESLATAAPDDVLHAWKGLGYYSRALNLHKAANQIVSEFNGKFPSDYHEILKLKGVGKYTAAAVASICFNEKIPAVDGNFYRVLSRIFADDFDVSQSAAFRYFSDLALRIMPHEQPGDFNQAIMDIGSEICKPRNPLCEKCPANDDCLAFATGEVLKFPVKTKKPKVTALELKYFFVELNGKFIISRRNEDFIWKNLYEFPTEIPKNWMDNIIGSKKISHKLTHKNLTINIDSVKPNSIEEFQRFAQENGFLISDIDQSRKKSFPKPLESFLESYFSQNE